MWGLKSLSLPTVSAYATDQGYKYMSPQASQQHSPGLVMLITFAASKLPRAGGTLPAVIHTTVAGVYCTGSTQSMLTADSSEIEKPPSHDT